MSDSSDEEPQIDYVFYKDRPEWKDVQPLEQDDGPIPVVAIDYTPIFRDCFDYLRAVMRAGEMSERALELTKTAVIMNPANYTAWLYRRDILKALNKNLVDELTFLEDEIIEPNHKNYQVWHHRKAIVELLQNAANEKRILDKILIKDSKNYHAWQHRQWVIKTFDLFKGELEYVTELLSNDLRNNSAWNHRFFVIKYTSGFTEEVMNREIQYTLNCIQAVKENESSWNYLKGILMTKGSLRNSVVEQFCEDLFQADNRSVFLLAFLVDLCYETIQNNIVNESKYDLSRALFLCNELATNYDTIRVKYWQYIAKNMEIVAEQVEANNS